MLVNNTLKVIMNLIKLGYYKVQHVVHTVTDIEIPRLGIPLDSTNQLDSMKPRETMKPMNTFRKPPCLSTSSKDEKKYIPYEGPYCETP